MTISSLLLDKTGMLWVGTEEGGLARFQKGAFETFTSRQGLADDLVQLSRGGYGRQPLDRDGERSDPARGLGLLYPRGGAGASRRHRAMHLRGSRQEPLDRNDRRCHESSAIGPHRILYAGQRPAWVHGVCYSSG